MQVYISDRSDRNMDIVGALSGPGYFVWYDDYFAITRQLPDLYYIKNMVEQLSSVYITGDIADTRLRRSNRLS